MPRFWQRREAVVKSKGWEVTEYGRELFDSVCGMDLEGIVAKRKADPYEARTAWYKIKNPAYSQADGRRELFERGVVKSS
jgi:ATP-dependent DNA ligase